ncbi:ferredoxin family protein [Cellulomonas sp. NTE-D12]|uniref:indolepyruvate ferredoxin oxidoreductase subunit alpha n=1 Tax=Cellulomonas sp. NTE-D12 TaxID=2962632 RepID=UPI00308120C2|nr:ferredoxin [Cellulomonas sp. NTE-D12]
MTYVIGKECIDVQDKSCIDVCPVDCIYEGGRKTYINPTECIDCGACELACPEVAIFPARKARGNEEWETFTRDNAAFFTEVLPGRNAPLGDPGGAGGVVIGVDTPLVTDWAG